MIEVYMDNASTTRLSKEVFDAMVCSMSNNYGNPSSLHKVGRDAHVLVENCRKNIAKVLGVKKQEIIFTSGATESDNMAIMGVCRANNKVKNHIITTKVEHKAILNTCRYLENIGYDITYLDVEESGIVSFDKVRDAIKDTTLMISIMAVNNEIGSIMPINDIAKLARKKGILFHTDAVAAFGNVDIDMKYIDMMSISGHKIYGPKGIGILYIRKGIKWKPTMYGGSQEYGMRPGTENVVGIKGLEVAIVNTVKNMSIESRNSLKNKRDYMLKRLEKEIKGIRLNGSIEDRIAGNINICIDNISGVVLADQLSREGIYVSTSSACNSKEILPSHVLKAIGISDEEALSAIRMTFDDCLEYDMIDYVVDKIVSIVEELREF